MIRYNISKSLSNHLQIVIFRYVQYQPKIQNNVFYGIQKFEKEVRLKYYFAEEYVEA